MVPGIVARDESCRFILRIIPRFNRRLIPGRNTRHNTRGQADAIFYPNSTVGGDVDSFFKFDASRVPSVSTTKHLTGYHCVRRIVTPRCEEEIGMTVLAELVRVVCILIFSLISIISTTS